MNAKTRSVIGVAIVAALVTAAGPAWASSTERVTERDLGRSWFTADTRAAGSLQFGVFGGRTAAKLATTSSVNDKVQLLTSKFDGLPLADIGTLAYDTWRDPASTGFAAALPALNIRADLDGNGTVDTYLVFEPYQDLGNTAVLTGQWQTWDAIRGGQAKWWSSSSMGGCPQSAPCTWSALLSAFPNAQVLEDPSALVSPSAPTRQLHGSLGLNLGSYNPGTIAAVDTLTVNDETFDFAPAKRQGDGCRTGDRHDGDARSDSRGGTCDSHSDTANHSESKKHGESKKHSQQRDN